MRTSQERGLFDGPKKKEAGKFRPPDAHSIRRRPPEQIERTTLHLHAKLFLGVEVIFDQQVEICSCYDDWVKKD